jgi:hypothetical protein
MGAWGEYSAAPGIPAAVMPTLSGIYACSKAWQRSEDRGLQPFFNSIIFE